MCRSHGLDLGLFGTQVLAFVNRFVCCADFVCAHSAACMMCLLNACLDCAQALRLRGHNVTDSTWSGVTQAVVLDTDLALLTAVSDPRKDGAPCAF